MRSARPRRALRLRETLRQGELTRNIDPERQYGDRPRRGQCGTLCLANFPYTPMLNASADLAERRRGVAGAWGQVARKLAQGIKEPR